MYDFETVKDFAIDWLQRDLDKAAHSQEAERFHALDSIAVTCWRFTAGALKDLLPGPDLLTTERLLHALYAIDYREGTKAAVDLCHGGAEPHSSIGFMFLEGLPPRCLRGVRLREPPGMCRSIPWSREEVLDRIQSPDLIDRFKAAGELPASRKQEHLEALFSRLGDESPGVVRSCLAAIRVLAPDRSIAAGRSAFINARCLFCLQTAAEFLVRLGEEGLDTLGALLKAKYDRDHLCAVIRAMVHWRPDLAVELIEMEASNRDNSLRCLAVDLVFEAQAVERDWPSPDAPRRLERYCQISRLAYSDAYEYVRASGLFNLVQSDWPQAEELAKKSLSDPSEIVRLAALDALDERGAPIDGDAVSGLLCDSQRCVSQRAFAMVRRRFSYDRDLVLRRMKAMMVADDPFIRRHLLQMVTRLGWPEGAELARRLYKDRDPGLRLDALAAVAALSSDRRDCLRLIAHRLCHKDWRIRRRAVELLAEFGDRHYLSHVVGRFRDPDSGVRLAALVAAVCLAPGQKRELATKALADSDGDVVDRAIAVLKESCDEGQMEEVVLRQLPRARGDGGARLFDFVQSEAPHRLEEAIARALKSRSEEARCKAAAVLLERVAEAEVPQVKDLLTNSAGSVRAAALRRLRELGWSETTSRAIAMARDPHPDVRRAALEILAADDTAYLADHLVLLARDEQAEIRQEALAALAKSDDPRALGELVSSLNDVDESVRTKARALLEARSAAGDRSSAAGESGVEPPWRQIVRRVEQINQWGARIGEELLGKPVVVCNYRQGLGRTFAGRKARQVVIEVSDTPVTSGHPWGEDVMRGLMLHEIGHHLCDFGVRGARAVRGIARSEGVGEIYDLLLDERLERILRARRPEWGVFFDRLASYAFAQDVERVPLEKYAALLDQSIEDTRRQIQAGRLPGRLLPAGPGAATECAALRDRDMLSIPGLVPPRAAFWACLRCGIDPRVYPDPVVAQALALVPENLKDLEHKELLPVAKRIGELLGKSDRFKREMRLLRERLRSHREALRALQKALDRWAETGQFPGLDPAGACGIRINEVCSNRKSSPALRIPKELLRGLRRRFGKDFNQEPGKEFASLAREKQLPPDPVARRALVASIAKHIRWLRWYLERLGTRSVEEYACRRGRRLDLAQVRSALWRKSPNLLVHGRDERVTSAYLGVLIDRSGSMASNNSAGQNKIELAKRFAVLLAESARGLRGIEGHVNAFDDSTFYRLGDFRQDSIASLTADQGNNDSGGLERAAHLALASRKQNKMLIMISDGSPTECTFESLECLVARLTRQCGIICVQVAVDKIERIAFPHYVDLSQYPMDEAVARFGRMVTTLTSGWR